MNIYTQDQNREIPRFTKAMIDQAARECRAGVCDCSSVHIGQVFVGLRPADIQANFGAWWSGIFYLGPLCEIPGGVWAPQRCPALLDIQDAIGTMAEAAGAQLARKVARNEATPQEISGFLERLAPLVWPDNDPANWRKPSADQPACPRFSVWWENLEFSRREPRPAITQDSSPALHRESGVIDHATFTAYLEASKVCPSDYRAGYRRGLRRLYHGVTPGEAVEHETYMAMTANRQATGDGYRDGYAGRQPKVAQSFDGERARFRTTVLIEERGGFVMTLSGPFGPVSHGERAGKTPDQAAATAIKAMLGYAQPNPLGGDLIAPTAVLNRVPPHLHSIPPQE